MKVPATQTTARVAGRATLLVALALATAAPPPAAFAASGSGEPPVAADEPSASCGEPATSSAPAMVACDSGGEGATACETKHTISVGGLGTVSGCGISCTNGWYACCQDPTLTKGATCTCRPNEPRGPWTPETAW